MRRHYLNDEGLVLKKFILSDNDLLLTLLTKSRGKRIIRAYGVKKITSRRISHLETGNYIRFSLNKYHDRVTLGETELMWGYSEIKNSASKMELLYMLFVVLIKILPEEEAEEETFALVVNFLKKLNNEKEIASQSFDSTLNSLLLSLGYLDQKTVSLPLFNPISFIEDLTDRKIDRNYFS